MGVHLGDFAQARTLQWSELTNKVVAVDAYNTLYQFLSSIRQADGTPLMDSKGRMTGHLTGLFYRSVKWLEAGVKPVFVFDGKPPELKRRTLNERKERKVIAEENRLSAIEEGRTEDAKRYAQQTSKLTPEMAAQAKSLLDALGIPHLQAPSEGEAQAAELVINGSAWASASQDFDSLLFGCPRLVRNLSVSGRRKVPRKNDYIQVEPELLELDALLKANSLTRPQLIWLGMLVGTDFNTGVMGIGPVKAMKLVAGADSFKTIIARLPESAQSKKSEIDGESIAGLEAWEEIEQFFLHPPILSAEQAKFQFRQIDQPKVVSLLCNEFDFSQERVTRTLDAFLKQQKEKGGQTSLGDW